MISRTRAPFDVCANILVLSPDRERFDCAFRSIIADLKTTIKQIGFKLIPLIDRIPDRLTELVLGEHDLLLSVQPVLECVHQRQTFLHSCLITFLNGKIFDLSFDHEQLGEEGKTLVGSRVDCTLLFRSDLDRFIELSSRMRMAANEGHALEIVIGGVAIDVRVSVEPL
jgi:hypothetical protein